ncbi:hypothetical protein CAAN1_01S06480 [[Candida] anglica]|uniref:Uncharacterized protein n=1 Tax=[Candida] anglica TaxID=148631 RepID=A0ABP0EP67_9ASCO
MLFSDKKTYHRQYLTEILNRGFNECSKAELAKGSFKSGISGDPSFRSRYRQEFSINNFVTYLECDNSLLRNGDIMLFPLLTTLNVLDFAISKDITNRIVPWEGFPNLNALTYLSINASSFSNAPELNTLISSLKRLDLFCHESEMNAVDGFSAILGNATTIQIEELNIFISDTCFLRYTEFLEFLNNIIQRGPNLQKLMIRIIRRKGDDSGSHSMGQWEVFSGLNGEMLVKIINSAPKLVHFGMNLALYYALDFSDHFNINESRARLGKFTISLIEPSLSVPKLARTERVSVSTLICRTHATTIRFYYGEVMEQSNIQALNLVSELTQYLDFMRRNGEGVAIETVSTEMCWSVSDDTVRRDYYIKLQMILEQLNASGNSKKEDAIACRKKLSTGTTWGRLPVNSPRYRVCESYQVDHKLSTNANYQFLWSVWLNMLPTQESELVEGYVPILNQNSLTQSDINDSKDFWSVEASLTDLEEYALKPRKRSRLWLDGI